MYVPAVRERVRVKGHDRLYLVVWVDHQRRTADLIALTESDSWMNEDIPFDVIHAASAATRATFSSVEPFEEYS
jgi:hypothetical protein